MDPRTSVQDVMRCDLCKTAVVQMHCDTCLVNLCKACVGEHISTGESKNHKVVKFHSRKSTPLYPGCKTHIDNSCELHCKDCDIPLCSVCIASRKHKDHDVHLLKDILARKKAALKTETNELEESIYPIHLDIERDVQNTLRQLDVKYEELSTAIKKHGDHWHREIDKYVKNFKDELDEMKNKHKEALKAHLSNIQTCTSKIKDDIDSLHKLMDSRDIFKVLNFPFDYKKYRILPPKLNITMAQFSPSSVRQHNFGKIIPTTVSPHDHGDNMKKAILSPLQQKPTEARSSPPVKQLLDEPETITTIGTGYESLFNVACLGDEEIWTSGDDRIIRKYSINQGSPLKSIKTKSGKTPFDIALTKSGDIIYTDYGTVNIVKNEKIEEMISLRHCIPLSVCSSSSGDLLVIMHSELFKETRVVRFFGSTEKQSIKFDYEAEPLYSSFGYDKYITENRNFDICVSDCEAKRVVVVNKAGYLRFWYTGHTSSPKNQPFDPRGITTDSQSHILTADFDNDCVHIIDQDGQFLRYIDCGLSDPWGLCTDTNDNLFVAQHRKRQVKKIKYLK